MTARNPHKLRHGARTPTDSFNDRAAVATTIILQLVSDGDDQGLDPSEVYLRIWRRLRDEFDDIAQEMATGAEQ
jgi:hypothetical protein